MTGIQLSVNWAVAQAAEALAASSVLAERDAGRSMRCCEAVGLDRLPKGQQEPGTQGVRVALRFYREADRATVDAARATVAVAIGQAMGLWAKAIQLDLRLLEHEVCDDKKHERGELTGSWLGIQDQYTRGGNGSRLDRFLTVEMLKTLEAKRGSAVWDALAKRPAEVRILLRRLRYRLGQDYGANDSPNYAIWTTETTMRWAIQEHHDLRYLVHKLSYWSDGLVSGHADPAVSLDTGYWGEVDTEIDPLRLGQLTTRSGTTAKDVHAVLEPAGAQVLCDEPVEVTSNAATNTMDPLRPFVRGLEVLLRKPQALKNLDVLLIHRGGGLNPTPADPDWTASNVTDSRRHEFLELCISVRDRGIEVVVALGHANISVLDWADRQQKHLPLGIFEATTPTAGAAWILQEHINPRLVKTGLIYSQARAT